MPFLVLRNLKFMFNLIDSHKQIKKERRFSFKKSFYSISKAISFQSTKFLKIKIDIFKINSLYSFLPFISNYFDSIYHVDVFYAWNKREMHDICDELFRVLRP